MVGHAVGRADGLGKLLVQLPEAEKPRLKPRLPVSTSIITQPQCGPTSPHRWMLRLPVLVAQALG
jgi:hypothetical protein